MRALAWSWRRAWHGSGATPDEGLFERVVAAYGEPHRHYHSLQHLAECLAQFEAAIALAQEPAAVELALWFHDAIHDPRRADNEARSADWAVEALTAAGVPEALRERVRALVLATRHDAIPADPDQRLLVDIDLAILGADAARFAEYEAQIRAEYPFVPEHEYAKARRAVLDGFLRREAIYSTAQFRSRLEARARANLGAALA